VRKTTSFAISAVSAVEVESTLEIAEAGAMELLLLMVFPLTASFS